MAKMHSRRKGKSSSTRPIRPSTPGWVDLSLNDIEALILKLAKKGESPSRIGIILRDQYGIPLVKTISNKKLTQMLAEGGVKPKVPEDLTNLLRRAVSLDRHNKSNHKDMGAKRGLQLIEAKIRRLAKYYKKNGKLPQDWKYNLDQAKLMVK